MAAQRDFARDPFGLIGDPDRVPEKRVGAVQNEVA